MTQDNFLFTGTIKDNIRYGKLDATDDEIIAAAKSVHAHDFIMKLEQKFPSITKAEKRLCVMLYIDMSSKEISVITNTSIRSVETSRYRLRKKFNLKTDKDIVDFLREI